MNFKKIESKFIKATKLNFPVKECTIQTMKDFNMFHSNQEYLCVLINTEDSNERVITPCIPYIHIEKGGVTLGWYSSRKDAGYANLEDSFDMLNSYVVVGFMAYENEEVDNEAHKQYVDAYTKPWYDMMAFDERE
jgi:hypothetical protein